MYKLTLYVFLRLKFHENLKYVIFIHKKNLILIIKKKKIKQSKPWKHIKFTEKIKGKKKSNSKSNNKNKIAII